MRVLMPRLAVPLLAPKLGQLIRNYPEILLDITTDDSRMDIVAGGFDAGIHFGEYIEKDMIAVRVSPDHRASIVASSTPAGFSIPTSISVNSPPTERRPCAVSWAMEPGISEAAARQQPPDTAMERCAACGVK